MDLKFNNMKAIFTIKAKLEKNCRNQTRTRENMPLFFSL